MTAAAPQLTFIPDIAEEHFDELQFLWGQRRKALRSPTVRERELLLLEERIEAHAQGLAAIGDRVVDFVEPSLAGDDEMPAFAAAFALLRHGTPDAVRRAGSAFESATGNKIDGLRDALASVPAVGLIPQLTALFVSGAPRIAAAAGEVLAFQRAGSPDARYLQRLVSAEDPPARESAWRLVAYCGTAVPPGWYDAALRDEAAATRHAALAAAAWAGSPAFASHCRALASDCTPEAVDAVATYAAVAPPEEYQLVAAVAANRAAGPNRFRVVGAFAHPYFVDLLIKEMENPDPVAALSAAAAFEKMTGRSPESDRRVKVSADGKPPADAFEAEFQDEVFLPDPALARQQWGELAPRLAHAPRICRGMDVSQPLSREQFAALDTESRWEHCLRARLYAGWQGTPLVLDRYPQRF